MATGARFFYVPKGTVVSTQLDNFLSLIGKNNLISINTSATSDTTTIIVIYETSSLLVTGTSPENGAIDLGTSLAAIVTFDRDIATDKVVAKSYIEAYEDGALVTSLVDTDFLISNNQLSISNLLVTGNKEYQVIIKKGFPALNTAVLLQTDLVFTWTTA